MIKIEKLHKSYPIGGNTLHVLKGIDLNIKEGELVAIMGSSGSGKSTLLNIIGMLDNYDEGSYILDDILIKNLNETKAAQYRNKFLGFIFQSFNLINYKTAVENIALPLYYQGIARNERNKIALEYLKNVGLENYIKVIVLFNALIGRKICFFYYLLVVGLQLRIRSSWERKINMLSTQI